VLQTLSPEQLQACKAKGGEAVFVRFHMQSCLWPTKDGRRACTDTTQCAGVCEAPFGTPLGTRVTGTCASKAADIRGGCVNEVAEGKSLGDICAE
jgi:hypothetical protein